MIGVLLTSTCYFRGISKKQLNERCEDLANCIVSLPKHIDQPYELIIADNSTPDLIPTEKLLTMCPDNTTFIRHTKNPGKHSGEAILVRDGVNLSAGRGHEWLFKLTGRYHLFGDWSLSSSLKTLETSGADLLISLTGSSMREMPWATNHPMYHEYLASDKILISALTHVFLARPEKLVRSGLFKREYLYNCPENLNYEQVFYWAVKDMNIRHWSSPPVDGWIINRNTKQSVYERTKLASNPVFENVSDYNDIPCIDISPLIE
ncbi:hypothetical protein MNBD_NITROSPINAE02-666 [hydrothermal vent metagenome]|uniref:Glycosyltransferase 2-like domain-containing protein n=1 Tax=hydrothermal vent metagenome TaxID=652676 RepID=A0A3B1CFI1_9ZZZZ